MNTVIYQFKAPTYIVATIGYEKLHHDLIVQTYHSLAHIVVQDTRHSDKYAGLILSDLGLGTDATAHRLA